MSENGIFVAGAGGSIDDKRNITYDSTKSHLQVDVLNKSPKLFDVVTMDAGSALNVPAGFAQSEDVFSITHGLGYKPTVWVYFYLYPKGTQPDTGKYATGIYFLNASIVTDKLTFDVNETSLRIIHTVDNTANFTSFTSTAATYTLRLKYYIFNNPASNSFVEINNGGIFAVN